MTARAYKAMENRLERLWNRLAVGNMLRRLMEEHFDGVFLIECATGEIWELGEKFSVKLRAGRSTMDGVPYDQQLRAAMEYHAAKDDQQMLVRLLCLDTVKQALAQQETYAVDVDTWRDENSVFCKRFVFYYLDETRSMIAVICEDATADLRNEVDTLTGMMNTIGFHRRVQEWISRHPGEKFRIQRYNVDRFRDINGLYGREVGDKLLRDLARHMRRFDRGEDCFSAHLNADHFVRFCAEGTMTLQECYDNFNSCFASYDLSIAITLHIGVYDLCEPDCDAATMSYKALLALQSIKGNQVRRIAYYEKGMMDEEREKGELLRDLERAISGREFEVWFQPQVDFTDRKMVGAEALVRWRHPVRGLLMPGVFVPLLEQSGCIHQLDRYMLEQCCRHIRRWQDDMPGQRFSVSVNLSREDLDRPGLCDRIDSILQQYGVSRDSLHLEVTESAYVEDTKRVMRAVDELRGRGFIVEMDDFGSGYSSLNALKDIDIDKLKLDMRFLSGGSSEKGRIIVQFIIGMAQALHLPIIAEGVETREQAEMLQEFGCREMQGYYFSRPVPADVYEQMLQDNARIATL